jgi:putative transcriptional regulator
MRTGMSQEKFADLCGLDRTYVSKVELGRVSPSLRNIYILATGLKVPLGELFSLVDENVRISS